MDGQKKHTKYVKTITEFSEMRFTPSEIVNDMPKNNAKLVQKLKSVLHWRQKSQCQSTAGEEYSGDVEDLKIQPTLHQLKFVRRLTMEHLLIGNQNQLDAISIKNASQTFLQTQELWSIKAQGRSIDFLVVDMKKSIIVLANRESKKISLRKFIPKKIHQKPTQETSIILPENPIKISLIRDLLCVFYEKKFETYWISSNFNLVKKIQSLYAKDLKDFQLLKAPTPIDTTLNIFLAQKKPHSSTFVLWLVQVEYTSNEIEIRQPQKIYDVKNSLLNKIHIKNYSKNTFIVNLGAEVLAFKKGYVIDSVNINNRNENTFLKYLGNDTMALLSKNKFEIYNFKINTSTKPYKIDVNSKDSMSIKMPQNSQFIDTLQVFNGNFIVILQLDPLHNKKLKGEVTYFLAVTQPIQIEHKIDLIFPRRKLALFNEEELHQRIDMASKMGLTDKQIYLQLWSRSNKEESNFPLLIQTKDYDSIRIQLMNMMKKSSVNFTQVYKLELSSFEMLRQFVYSPKCTKEYFFWFISCHFLIKKLEYYRDATLLMDGLDKTIEQGFKVSIKKFYQIKDLHLINHLNDLVKELCLENKPVQQQIRLFLTTFKFPLRAYYTQILLSLIKSLGSKFLNLLELIPEILPYQYSKEESENFEGGEKLYLGIWEPMSKRQIREQLFWDTLVTIDNKEIVEQSIKDIWFRRVNLTNHIFITDSETHLEQQFNLLNSEQIFYQVIKLIVDEIKEQERPMLFAFLEEKYEKKLSHLRKRINLYNMIYAYLRDRNLLPLDSMKFPITFNEFLSLKDASLFNHLFEIEKSRKGLILQQIKPIYEGSRSDGANFFNACLLEYFKSDLSQVSDIKYLLNRINNERRQFHMKNHDMYSVLVDAMTIKLKVGTGNDIPLDEILIYIENIPMEKNYDVLDKLCTISSINKNVYLMQEARVNMTVLEIMESPQVLMLKIIDYLLANTIYEGMDEEQMQQNSYNILANLEHLHNQICKDHTETTFYIFFVYLIKLAEHKYLIPHMLSLIRDPNLAKQFNFEEISIAESLVVFLYKSRMTESPVYVENQDYLSSLVHLLPEESEIRQFIICEFQLAKMLTGRFNRVKYPLSQNNSIITKLQLEENLAYLTIDELQKIDINAICAIIQSMYSLNSKVCTVVGFMEDNQRSELLSSVFRPNHSELTKKQIYQQFIMRYLHLKRLREMLPILEIYFSDPQENSQFDVVYPILYLNELSDDLNSFLKEKFLHLVSIYFTAPHQLFQVIKKFVLTPLSIKERLQMLEKEVQKAKESHKELNFDNNLLNGHLIKNAKVQGLESKLATIFFNSFQHIRNSRKDFQNLIFSFIFAALINNPMVLSKLILNLHTTTIVKNISLFLNYVIKQKTFDPLICLEAGQRVFMLALISIKDDMNLQEVLRVFQDIPLEQDLPEEFWPKYQVIKGNIFLQLLYKTSLAFKNEKHSKRNYFTNEDFKERMSQQMNEILQCPSALINVEPIEYSGIEAEEQNMQDLKISIKMRKSKTTFDGKKQIQRFVKKKTKDLKAGHIKAEEKEELADINHQLPQDPSKEHSFENHEKDQEYQKEEEAGAQPIIRIIQNEEKKTPEQVYEIGVQIQQEEQHKKKEANGQYNFLDTNQNIQAMEIIRKSSLSSKNIEVPEQAIAEFVPPKVNEEEKKKIFQKKKPEILSKSKTVSRASSLHDIPDDKTNQKKSLIQEQRGQASPKASSREKQKQNRKGSGDFVGSSIRQISIRIEGFPPVEQVGKKLYQNNLIAFENPKKRKYKIEILAEHEAKPEFSKFLVEIMKYVYYQSNDSPIEGIMGLFQFLSKKYDLNLDEKNFGIWKKGQKLHKRYDLDFNIRKLLPIDGILEGHKTKLSIFEGMKGHLIELLDDGNVYKIAKLMGLSFQSQEIESQVIYAYLTILASRKVESNQQIDITQEKEKLEVVIQKIPPKILSMRFNQLYHLTHEMKKNELLVSTLERVRHQGVKEQKVQLLKQIVEIDKSYEPMLFSVSK